MNNYVKSQGINIYVGSAEQLATIPLEHKTHCLLVEINNGNILQVGYYDPIQGKKSLDIESIDSNALKQMSEEKGSPFQEAKLHLIHLHANELPQLIPHQHHRHIIRNPVDIARQYFDENPLENKLSRKKTGLANSYIRGEDNHILQLASKQECRMAWSNKLPTQQIFNNLPANTEAAYVLVESDTRNRPTLYYLKKGNDEASAKKISTVTSTDLFMPFKSSNRGLSKQELFDISDLYGHKHAIDTQSLYGEGGFGRVKQSNIVFPEISDSSRATKVQILEKSEKIQNKMAGRTKQISLLKDEVAIAHDFNAADPGHMIIKDKSYFHMKVLGTPLAKKIQNSSMDQQIDFAIKFLIEVHQAHTGQATKSGLPYAHRDIKIDNVLVDSSQNLHLIDFGFATTNIKDKQGVLCGTLLYAPLDQSVIDGFLKDPVPHNDSLESSLSEESNHSLIDESFAYESEYQSSSEEGDSDKAIAQTPIQADKKVDWKHKLLDSTYCLTENFLEDDKIAALRTIYCNPKGQNAVHSIFNQTSFHTLPKPIQSLLDTTHIAPLLSQARRKETELFFAAVLIAYRNNPNLSEQAYEKLILDLRVNPEKQIQLLEGYTNVGKSTVKTSSKPNIEMLDDMMDEGRTIKLSTPTKSISRQFKETLNYITGRNKRARAISPDLNNDSGDNDYLHKKLT